MFQTQRIKFDSVGRMISGYIEISNQEISTTEIATSNTASAYLVRVYQFVAQASAEFVM